MRYVFVTDELPRPGVAGHLALNFAILDWLRGLGHEVAVLLVGARLGGLVVPTGGFSVAGPHVRQSGNFVVPRGVRDVAGILARAGVRALPVGLAARVRGARHQADTVLGQFASAEDVAWCARTIAELRPDAVLIDTIFRAGVLAAPELGGMNSLVVAHDVFFRRHVALRSAGYSVAPAVLTREDEAGWLRGAGHIAAIQPEEAGLLTGMCPSQNVFLMPMPAVVVPPPEGGVRLAGRLVFVGSGTLPNLDGLRWFFEAVWPLLRGRGMQLDLVGDCGAALRHVPENVTRLGRVKNLGPVLHRAALAVAPLRVGSGLKIKLLDYARHGLFTVATPASLAGFAEDDATPFIAAADAAAFARAVVQMVARPAAADVPLAYVARHYGAAASFAGLGEALGLSPAAATKAT